jgi:hypothetical protein
MSWSIDLPAKLRRAFSAACCLLLCILPCCTHSNTYLFTSEQNLNHLSQQNEFVGVKKQHDNRLVFLQIIRQKYNKKEIIS